MNSNSAQITLNRPLTLEKNIPLVAMYLELSNPSVFSLLVSIHYLASDSHLGNQVGKTFGLQVCLWLVTMFLKAVNVWELSACLLCLSSSLIGCRGCDWSYPSALVWWPGWQGRSCWSWQWIARSSQGPCTRPGDCWTEGAEGTHQKEHRITYIHSRISITQRIRHSGHSLCEIGIHGKEEVEGLNRGYTRANANTVLMLIQG